MPWTDRLSATDREWVEALIHREVAAYDAEHPSDADGRRINATVKTHEDAQSGAIVALEIRVEDRLPLFLFHLRDLSSSGVRGSATPSATRVAEGGR